VTLVSDGKEFARGVAVIKKYVVGDAPAAIEDVFKDQSAALLSGGVGIGAAFFHALLSDDPYKGLTEGVTESSDLGAEDVDGHECRHLHFEEGEFGWDAWIQTGTPPLIPKVAFQFSKFPGSGGQPVPDLKLSIVFNLHDWDLDPKFSENEFAFAAPDDWEKTDNLFGRTTSKKKAPSPLLGKAAPDFQLDKLGGGTGGLEAHRDKEVVILDFWATWCPPCIEGLPIVAKVAAKYRDQGVVLYAVNEGESAKEVEPFLAEQKLDLPVVFDSEGSVGDLYRVSGIPQTVVIGKDGKVQVVHVGFREDLEERLSGELEDVLAGKDLAAETLKAYAEEKASDMPEDGATTDGADEKASDEPTSDDAKSDESKPDEPKSDESK
jgi:thiol-disulfide isomerase/thioredoxin